MKYYALGISIDILTRNILLYPKIYCTFWCASGRLYIIYQLPALYINLCCLMLITKQINLVLFDKNVFFNFYIIVLFNLT